MNKYSVTLTDAAGHSENADAPTVAVSADQWKKRMATLKKRGAQAVRRMKSQGRTFQARVLGPLEVPKERFESGEYTLVAVPIDRDWKLPTKLEMVRDANNLLTNAYKIGALDHALPIALGAAIKGEGLYKYSMGEFFLLYGRFEQKYEVRKGPEVEARMNDLLQGNEQGLKDYVQGGKTKRVPLPYAVRNILAHVGRNPNQVTVEELRVAVELLKSWVGD